MPQTNNPILDDLARLMTDAAGMAQGVRREAETRLRHGIALFKSGKKAEALAAAAA